MRLGGRSDPALSNQTAQSLTGATRAGGHKVCNVLAAYSHLDLLSLLDSAKHAAQARLQLSNPDLVHVDILAFR